MGRKNGKQTISRREKWHLTKMDWDEKIGSKQLQVKTWHLRKMDWEQTNGKQKKHILEKSFFYLEPFFSRYRFPQGGFLPRQHLPSVEFPSRASSSKPTPCHMRLPRVASAQGLSSNFFGACACHDELDSHQRRVHPRLGVARCACHIPIRDVSFGTFALPRAPASVSTPWFS